jgi:hypothetical protein
MYEKLLSKDLMVRSDGTPPAAVVGVVVAPDDDVVGVVDFLLDEHAPTVAIRATTAPVAANRRVQLTLWSISIGSVLLFGLKGLSRSFVGAQLRGTRLKVGTERLDTKSRKSLRVERKSRNGEP